jgi:tetratricopeptide (TPR) repeat protein
VTAYGRPEYHEQVAAARATLGEVYRDLGKYDESEQLLRSALRTYELLVAGVPEVLDYAERQAVTRGQLGQTLAADDQTEAATNELQLATAEFEALLELAPDTPDYLNAAAFANWHLGEATIFSSPDEANRAFERAIELWGTLAGASPSPEHLNGFAWFLVMCIDAKWQNGERAVQLADAALKLQPSNDRYRTTLGAAYYRQGNFDSCENALSPLAADGHSPAAGRFFFAMSLAKRGQSADARTYYDAANAWLREQQPGNRLLQRLQQETLSVIEEAAASAQ